jgi:hypothetical protein
VQLEVLRDAIQPRAFKRCPLLAQSGHALVHCTCPLSGVKQTSQIENEAYIPDI